MSQKLYVAQLPFVYSDAELRALFEAIGPVLEAVMVPDVKNKCTRGFGFVTMGKEEDAQRAIKDLNAKPIGQRNIWVTEAREKPKPSAAAPTPDRPQPFSRPPRSEDRSGPRYSKRQYGPGNESRRPFQRPPERGGFSDDRQPRRPFQRPPERGGFSDDRPPRRFGSGPGNSSRPPFRRGPERSGSPDDRPQRQFGSSPGNSSRTPFQRGPGRGGFSDGRPPRRFGSGPGNSSRPSFPRSPERGGFSDDRPPRRTGPKKSFDKPFKKPFSKFSSGPRQPRFD